jgi:GDP-L-fucose synthase
MDKILVTGATGFLGKHVCDKLDNRKYKYAKTSLSLGCDLSNEKEVYELFNEEKPDFVINCAAYVGGIQWGYKHFGEIFSNNLKMNVNLMEACRRFGIKKIINPISNCVYPAQATLFKEEDIWDGAMHESVQVYGFVRKAMLVGTWAYKRQYGLEALNIVLSNMYGPGDHFEAERSHALGALIKKIVDAKFDNKKEVIIWGTGKPVREWLHICDGAEALIRGMEVNSRVDLINVGWGKGISIWKLAELIRELTDYEGDLVTEPSKPDGAEYKTVDGSKGEKILKWKPEIVLEQGIKETIKWYIDNRRIYDQ